MKARVLKLSRPQALPRALPPPAGSPARCRRRQACLVPEVKQIGNVGGATGDDVRAEIFHLLRLLRDCDHSDEVLLIDFELHEGEAVAIEIDRKELQIDRKCDQSD